jgi:hypothetical protein
MSQERPEGIWDLMDLASYCRIYSDQVRSPGAVGSENDQIEGSIYRSWVRSTLRNLENLTPDHEKTVNVISNLVTRSCM